MKIENTREIFFTSKEQYLHLRKVWSQAVNDKRAKKTTSSSEYGTFRHDGWLTGAHHLIYALLRGRDATNGFTPVTSQNKLENGSYINYGLYAARNDLSRKAKAAKRYINTVEMGQVDKSTAHNMGIIGDFLKPFDGAVTPQMIIKLDEMCPSVELLESHYGKGVQIAKAIIAAEVKPTSYNEMMDILREGAL